MRVKEFEGAALPVKLLANRNPISNYPLVPTRDPLFNYYQQFCHLTIANMVMQSHIKKLLMERQEMLQRIQRLHLKKKEDDVKGKGEEESIRSSSNFLVPAAGSIMSAKQVRTQLLTAGHLVEAPPKNSQ